MVLTFRRFLTLALASAVVLAVPALAAAAGFKVTSTGDSGATATQEACKTSVGECTLRAAIIDANAASDLDEITFGPTFDGGPGSTISLGSTLTISPPWLLPTQSTGRGPRLSTKTRRILVSFGSR